MREGGSVKVPGRLPVFWMSTVPGTVSPGLRLVALNSALDELLPMPSVPAVKVFEGFAALAVKFAPDPTVMPTAARTTASAAMVRRGCAARADRRDTQGLRGMRERDTSPGPRRTGSVPFGVASGRRRVAHPPSRQHRGPT